MGLSVAIIGTWLNLTKLAHVMYQNNFPFCTLFLNIMRPLVGGSTSHISKPLFFMLLHLKFSH